MSSMATQPSADGVGTTSEVMVNSAQENLTGADPGTLSPLKAFLNDK